ncbi:hypothetical protein [Photobacterium kishitanii]|uniref:Uncharacterized protein n=1 Tax=Photobacterium kishitanii TaxID=318456 RepID=A0A2T3KKX7_9GAMM|nr:hypothetical protein [Photobacterium kishitanii]PSV00374.1 hypothetical protein C9J27_04400 [Photobacterium kishitanii]
MLDEDRLTQMQNEIEDTFKLMDGQFTFWIRNQPTYAEAFRIAIEQYKYLVQNDPKLIRSIHNAENHEEISTLLGISDNIFKVVKEHSPFIPVTVRKWYNNEETLMCFKGAVFAIHGIILSKLSESVNTDAETMLGAAKAIDLTGNDLVSLYLANSKATTILVSRIC